MAWLSLLLAVAASPVAAMPVRVVDAQGQPVAGAEVFLREREDGAPSVRLRQTAGAFALPWVSQEAAVAAAAPGHAPAGTWASPGDAGLVLTLPPARPVTGSVFGPDGLPCEGVTVRLAAVTADRRAAGDLGGVGPQRVPLPPELRKGITTQTNAGGVFRLEGVPPERIWLEAADPRFVTETLEICGDVVNFRMRPGCRVRGRLVRDEKPVAGQQVVACALSTGNPRTFAVTEADGTFLLAGLAPGGYDVGVDVPPDAPFTAPAVRVSLSPTMPEDNVLLRASAGGIVRVAAVDDESGKPLAGVPLLIEGRHRTRPGLRRVVTGPDGTVRIRAPARQVHVRRASPFGMLSYPGVSVTAKVQEGQDVDAELKVHHWREIGGEVVDAAGHSAAHVAVEARQGDEYSWWAVTNSRGHFTVRNVYRDMVLSLIARRGDEGTPPVRIPRDSTARARLVLAPLPQILLTGRVVDTGGVPVGGVPVRLGEVRDPDPEAPENARPCFVRTVITGSDGSYRFMVRLPAADYRVSADPDACEPVGGGEPLGDQGAERRFKDLVVRRRESVLQGRVVDAAQRPAAGAVVFWIAGGPRHVVVSSPDGAFRIEGLPSRPLLLGARSPEHGYCLARVSPGTPATLVLAKGAP